MVLVVGYEGKQLLICTSYGHPSFLCGNLTTLSLTFFLPSLIFESPPTGVSLLFFIVREFGSALPRTPHRIPFELTYFSEAFARTAKSGDSGRVEKRRAGRKKKGERKGSRRIVKRATRALDGRGPHSWSNYLFFR